jgi:Integrase core domain
MTEVISHFGLSFRRVCRLTGWNRSSLQYQPEGLDDTALRERLRHWAALKPRSGAPILHDVLKAEGLVINHKRTERASGEEGLSLRRKRRKKLPGLARVPIPQPERPNERWSMDFIHDQLSSGRRLRCLTVVDDFTGQCLAIHWRSCDYNRLRPHSSIGRVPPDVFALPFLNPQSNKPVILHPARANIRGQAIFPSARFS